MTGESVAMELIKCGDISITENGHVIRHKRRGRSKPYDPPARIDYETDIGYFCFKCGLAGDKRRTVLVHRAVWVQANGPIPKGLEINHIDEIKSHNWLGNLELKTHLDNILHSSHAWDRGESHRLAKLTESDVIEIRRLASTKEMKRKDIAAKFGLAPEYLWKVITRRTWKHVA